VSELQDRIREIIESEPVALFMKGTPEFIACGNSARALEALRAVGAPVAAVDVLPDPQIRVELTALSGWPTIPQVFIGGELVGGADITEELYESGELAQKVKERLGDAPPAPASERVIELAGGNPFRIA
jgi:monothiol glutaredoxin